MNDLQLTLFDYSQLDTETRIIVQQRTTEIKGLMKRTAQDIIEIGEKLIDVKDRLPHGEFGGWLEAEFEWNNVTASKYMNVARAFSNIQNSEHLTMSFETMAYLAAPSTPDEARQAAIGRAEAGERITHQAAKGIVDEYKPKSYAPQHSTASSGRASQPEPERPGVSGVTWSEDGATATVEVTNGDVAGGLMAVMEAEQPTIEKTSRIKPKTNYGGDPDTSHPMDRCQTPAYAVAPLLPYVRPDWTIWEPAAGEGYLVRVMAGDGRNVEASDILTGQNFFEFEPTVWDCIVTNPPFSIKYDWLARCYDLGKPFALLLPVETIGTQTAQRLFRQYGLEVIWLDKRVNFKMPYKGWGGSAAQFPVAWFTWGLDLGQQMIFEEINRNG